MSAPIDTHTIVIDVVSGPPDSGKSYATVIRTGDGKIDHVLGTFRAALVAMGFPCDVAVSLSADESMED